MSVIGRSRPLMSLVPPNDRTIDTYLPIELLREIFLYSIESNHMKSGQLASVCRYWRSVITSIASLWSTLRVGTWTETEQVALWLQRAYPKKVFIDPQRDSQSPSEAPMFAALQNTLTSTGQWHELTISSFPPEDLASQLGVQVASPMNVLKVLHVAAGCVHSPSFAHLLNLVPTEAPLSELRLHSSFSSTPFLQPHWFPVLKNLTVLIVSGRDIHEPFALLPDFTQLQAFEADRLRFPFYEPNTNMPLLCTLRKLQLRASSVQWMAGRQFPRLEECAILLPRHWEAIQQHEVQLPSCKKLSYHGHPMTTAQYFHAPKMRAMELKCHDCNERRVYQHLRHLCRVDGRISTLTTLHLKFQCSEQVLIKVLKYLVTLQELILSVVHPSPVWQSFLESLVAKPSAKEWPAWGPWLNNRREWEEWCSSQTWHANVLPHLKYLGIQCLKGFYQPERIDISILLRHVGWTRAHLTRPLEHLEVWEGRGSMDDMAVDYISTGSLEKHTGISNEEYDAMILKGMVAGCLVVHFYAAPLFPVYPTVLFRRLQRVELTCYGHHEIPILPYLEQIKWLQIEGGFIPVYSLSVELPLTHTLHWLKLRSSPSWMLGRTFKALREFEFTKPYTPWDTSGLEGLQVDLPACRELTLWDFSVDHLHFFSCPNVQVLRLQIDSERADVDVLKSFLSTCSCLQELGIRISQEINLDSLIQFVFCGARAQGVWQDIRNVEVEVRARGSWTKKDTSNFFSQIVGQQRDFDKWWKKFTVAKNRRDTAVTVRASI